MFDRRKSATLAPRVDDASFCSAQKIADALADAGRTDLLADLLALHADAQAYRALVAN